jgi:DNA polymerase III delta prime subunit
MPFKSDLTDINIVKCFKEICQIEGLRADSRALSTLPVVSVAKGDLRGCLNTLQVCGMAFLFLTAILMVL